MFLAASSSVLVLARTRTISCISWEWAWLWGCNQEQMLLYNTFITDRGGGKALTLQGKGHSFLLGENPSVLERTNQICICLLSLPM